MIRGVTAGSCSESTYFVLLSSLLVCQKRWCESLPLTFFSDCFLLFLCLHPSLLLLLLLLKRKNSNIWDWMTLPETNVKPSHGFLSQMSNVKQLNYVSFKFRVIFLKVCPYMMVFSVSIIIFMDILPLSTRLLVIVTLDPSLESAESHLC